MALRFDLTVPLARFAAMHIHELGTPFRRYHIAPVWRAEKPQRGRYREFIQCDFDIIGTSSVLADAEIILVINETFKALEIPHKIRLNNRLLLNGFLEGLGDGVFDADAETLAAMRNETRRLHRLTRDLGSLSRSVESAFDLDVEESDLGMVAAAAARAVSAAAQAVGVEVRIGEMPGMPVEIDVDRMGQVFTNLLNNALQHTPPGHVSVAVAGEHQHRDRVDVAGGHANDGVHRAGADGRKDGQWNPGDAVVAVGQMHGSHQPGNAAANDKGGIRCKFFHSRKFPNYRS